MKKFILAASILATVACKKQTTDSPYPCLDGACNTEFFIDSAYCDGHLKSDGYWHVKTGGLKYLRVKGRLAQLAPEYVINKVPLIEVSFDSDYWLAFDSIQFNSPLYNTFGAYSDRNFNSPISVGNKTYTIATLRKETDVTNLVGYVIDSHMCLDCPYSKTLVYTYSKYTYEPQKEMFLLGEMKGDTANILINTTYNCDLGQRVNKKVTLHVIFE